MIASLHVLVVVLSLSHVQPDSQTVATPAVVAEQAEVDLQAVIARYRQLQSYCGMMEQRMEVNAPGATRLAKQSVKRTHVAFVKPNKLGLQSQAYAVFCDGVTLYLIDYEGQRYARSAAPAALRMEDIRDRFQATFGESMSGHPIATLAFDDANTSGVATIASAKQHRQTPTSVVFRNTSTLQAATVAVDYEIDRQSQLLSTVTINSTEFVKQGLKSTQAKWGLNLNAVTGAPETIERVAARYTLSDENINTAIDDAIFAWSPALRPDMVEVPMKEAKEAPGTEETTTERQSQP
jgi:hypothetical protein